MHAILLQIGLNEAELANEKTQVNRVKLIKTKPNIYTDMSTDESKSIENKIIQTTNVALSIKIEKIKIK